MQVEQSSLFFQSPSFNCYTSQKFAEIAAKVTGEYDDTVSDYSSEVGITSESEDKVSDNITEEKSFRESKEDKKDGEDFEFSFSCREKSPISADEIFSNGQIRPVYPIFNRDLLLPDGEEADSKPVKSSTIRLTLSKFLFEERDSVPSSSSSEADELEGVPAGTYCVWRPKTAQASPEICQKSNSTGSSKRWRFRNLLHRSNSDGKDTFVFLAPSATSSNTKTKKKTEKAELVEKPEIPPARRNSGEGKVVGNGKAKGKSGEKMSAHEIYSRNRAMNEVDRRRSYLPYRQDIVGFFSNVNGLGKTLQPF